MTDPKPEDPQEIDIFKTKTLGSLDSIRKELEAVRGSIEVLSRTLAAHVRQNIDTFTEVREYISDQMSYRLFRQGLEENNIMLELEKKKLELEFSERRFKALEEEHEEGEMEAEQVKLKYDKQKAELEAAQRNLVLLQNVKQSTKDKIAAVKTKDPIGKKVLDTIILTAMGTITAAVVGGTIAFVLWLIRLYLTTGKP